MKLSTLKSLGLALVLASSVASVAYADDQWKDKGKDCDAGAFKSPKDADLDALVLCSKLWVAYRTDLKGVKGEYKDNVVTAMKELWTNGEDGDAKRAKTILASLGVNDLPERTASAPPAPKAPPRPTFAPKPATKAEIAAAEKQFKAGFAKYKAKDYKAAAGLYEKMVAAAPGYAKGHYNAACVYALLKDEPNMAKYLLNLRDMAAAGDKDAATDLKMSRTDADFADFKNQSVEYKRITGYANILIINDIGDKGEENVDNLVGSLKKLGYDPKTKTSDKKPLKKPFIFYAEHAKTQAYITKKLISHPALTTKLLPKEKLCNDDGCFDVVVQWSDDVKGDGDPKVFVADPDDAAKKIDALGKEEDDILAKPNDAADQVDEALGKPDEVKDKVDDTLKTPGKALDKVDKTIDKVKGVF